MDFEQIERVARRAARNARVEAQASPKVDNSEIESLLKSRRWNCENPNALESVREMLAGMADLIAAVSSESTSHLLNDDEFQQVADAIWFNAEQVIEHLPDLKCIHSIQAPAYADILPRIAKVTASVIRHMKGIESCILADSWRDNGGGVETGIFWATRFNKARENVGVELVDLADQIDACRLLGPVVTIAVQEPLSPDDAPSIQKCWHLANQSRDRAIQKGAPCDTLAETYQWLSEFDDDAEYKLPNFTAWGRYLCAYKNAVASEPASSPRGGRKGRSIVSRKEN